MRHEDRVQAAEFLASDLIRHFGKDICVVLLSGSTARGDDSAGSDLDLFVVTRRRLRFRRGSDTGFVRLAFDDVVVVIRFMTFAQAVGFVKKPDVEWPAMARVFIEPTVVAGYSIESINQVINSCKEAYLSLQSADFARSIEAAMTLILENRCKMRTGAGFGSLCMVSGGARHMVYMANMLVALINRRFYRHGDCRFLKESAQLPVLPRGFLNLCTLLYEDRGIDSLLAAGERLANGCMELMLDSGYALPVAASVEDLVRNARETW